MGVGVTPRDDNGVPVLSLWNDATGKPIPAHVGATVTGADGNTYGKLDVDVTVTVPVSTSSTGTKSNVGSSASSVTILAANANRKGATIYNDSTQILYLDLSGGTASSSSYSTQVGSQQLFELPGPTIYTGLITGIWASANGNARVTEFS